MRPISRYFFTLFLCGTLLACDGKQAEVTVGNRVFTKKELVDYMERSGTKRASEKLRAQLIDKLIADELLCQAARKQPPSNISEIEARIEDTSRRLLAEAFVNEKLKDAPESELRRRYEMQVERFREKKARLGMIVARYSDPDSKQKAKSKIETAHSRLKAGEDFSSIVGQYSDDTPTASKGGRLEDVLESELNPKISEHVFDLEKNEITQPIDHDNAFFLFKMIESPTVMTKAFEDVRSTLVGEWRAEKKKELIDYWQEKIGVEKSSNE